MDDTKTSPRFGIVVSYAVFFALAFWLLFYHLDNHLLWGDEAETAVLAKNVVQFGVPRTYDGTNYLILHGTVDETPGHIWTWSPWMQNYLAASSFMLFGPTTWAARAPFAFIGWCSLLLLALTAWRIYRSHWVALSSVALLAASEVFLLHARQCRYYSISVFAEILFVYGAFELLSSRRRGVWLTALALILQFYSNYIIATASLPALLYLVWLLRRQGKAAIFSVVFVSGVFTTAVLPWLVFAHPWRQSNAMGHENYFGKAFAYLAQIHFLFVPLCFFLLPLLGLLSKDKGTVLPEPAKSWERFLLFVMPIYFCVILLAPGFYLRYQLPLLPLLCLLAAAWVLRYVRWRAVAVALIVVQLGSNALSIATGFPFRHGRELRSPIVEYVSGIAAPYSNRLSDALDFFKTHAHPGQRVLSFDPEFPLIFYTGLGVIDGLIMTPPAGQLPDWILPVSVTGDVTREPGALPELQPRYTLITISVHDSSMFDSIPEPDVYQFHATITRVSFQIYQLNANTNASAR